VGFSQNFADNSVLSEGAWYKIGIVKTGVYKLDHSFLKKLGALKNGIDPQKIKLYGNGGKMLPQANHIPRPDDLLENAIIVEGESDGKFDNGDYILFFGHGTESPVFSIDQKRITVTPNIYSDTSYYFITVSNTNGKRISAASMAEGGTEISTFDDYIHHELENVNILSTTILQASESGSGREWYGEDFGFNTAQTFNLNLEGLTNNSKLKVHSSVLGCSTLPSTFTISLNSIQIGEHNIQGITEGVYNSKGEKSEDAFVIDAASFPNPAEVSLQYAYDKKSNSFAKGFLNFFTINFNRSIKLYGVQTSFRSFESLNYPVCKFKISGLTQNCRIWDITDSISPYEISFHKTGETGEFSTTTDALKEFVVFDPQKLETPFSFGKISNQNLHALPFADMIIVSHPLFVSEAQRLANFRQENDGLSVQVVTTREIYNEFASGKQDISAIRDFLRLQYIKGNKLKYVLLFGDCSYDYKYRVKNNTNFVPVYEARESLNPIRSYSSDDYYGFMEESEGEWSEDSEGDHTLDIGVGRIPCKTIPEASIAVNKLLSYANNKKNLGNWRNKISFVADDGDVNTHLNDADRLTVMLDTSYSYLNVKKIYLDAYPQESTPSVTSIKTKETINSTVELGTLILNYTGHGGETGWTNERILETTDISNWDNKEKLPLIVTATCEFGKYDDPRQFTAAEVALFNPKGGAIALVTTTRPVFSSTNYILNKAFYETAFKEIDGRMPTLGEIMIYTKNQSLNGSINRNFALLGDPSLTLAYPTQSVEVLEINNKNVQGFQDTLKALSNVSIKGVIKDHDNHQSNFKGTLQVVVYDKPFQVSTLGNENPVTTFKTTERLLFKGNFSIENGAFSFSFTLPKNINYEYGKAKISLYAFDKDNLADAKGALSDIVLGGSSSTFPEDNNPPGLTLYLNDSTFKSGDQVHSNSVLKAKVWDESGINLTSTVVGQEIKAILVNEETKEIVLNEYFEPTLDDYKSGTITYPFSGLAPGKYNLSLKVWDIYNNSNNASINFMVIENKPINIKELTNFPNPFSYSTGTTFSFRHDRVGEDVEVKISIYTINGQLIASINRIIYKIEEENSDIKWQGTDSSGNKISEGLYIYRLEIRSLSDKNKSYRSEKLLLIN